MHYKQNKCAHDKQNKLLRTSNKSVLDCKLKFLHAANKITGLARAGSREGLWPSEAFPVQEELSRVISSTGTAASSNSNLMTPARFPYSPIQDICFSWCYAYRLHFLLSTIIINILCITRSGLLYFYGHCNIIMFMYIGDIDNFL